MTFGLVLEFNVHPDKNEIKFVDTYYIPEFSDIAILSFIITYLSSKATHPIKSIIIENQQTDSFKWLEKLKEIVEKHNYKVTSDDVCVVDLFFEDLPFGSRFIIFEVENLEENEMEVKK